MELLNWLYTQLGDAVRRHIAGRRWASALALRRYKRHVTDVAGQVPVPFGAPVDLRLPDAYLPVDLGDAPGDAPPSGAAHAGVRTPADPWTVVSARRRTLVLGPPGSGKSMLLRYLWWSSCAGVAGGRDGANGRAVTVLVPLDRVEELDGVSPAIVETLEQHGLSGARDLVRRELGHHAPRLLVLLDGLDEVRGDKRGRVTHLLTRFATQHPAVRFVVTCRTDADHGDLSGVVDQTVHALPLRAAEVERFLLTWPAMGSSRTAAWLVSALREAPWLASLVRNPLMLTKVAALCTTAYRGSAGALLHDRRRLCHEVAELFLVGWKGECNRERPQVKWAVLQHLAIAGPDLHAGAPGRAYHDILAEVRGLLPRYGEDPARAAEVLDEIVQRSGLLLRLDGGTRYRFAHVAVQSYLAALALDDQPDEVLRRYRDGGVAGRALLETWCRGDHDATKVVDDLAHAGDLPGALTCLAATSRVDDAVAARVIDSARAALLDDTGGDEVVAAWGHLVSSPSSWGRAGLDILRSRMGSPRALAALAHSRLPEAADLLGAWGRGDGRAIPQLERMGPVALVPLARLAVDGNRPALDAIGRMVHADHAFGASGRDGSGTGSARDETAIPQLEPLGIVALPPLARLAVDGSGPALGAIHRIVYAEQRPGPGTTGSVEAAEHRSPHRKAVAVAAAAVLALAVVAVTWPDRTDRRDRPAREGQQIAPERAEGTGMELVWTARARVASEPVLVDGVVVAHVVDGDGLALVGYDPASGRERWRRPSTGSEVPTGVVLSVVHDGARAFHMVPGPGDSASIEAVDVRSGDPVWRTENASGGFHDAVDFCGEDLCVNAVIAGDGTRPWTIDTASGTVTGEIAGFGRRRSAPTQPLEGRSLGHGLVDLFPSRDIARVVDGQVVWRRSPSELFGGRPVTSDMGWNWRTADGLLVGWLATATETPEFGWADVVPQYTAGIDAATGDTVWVAEGEPHCGDRLSDLDLSVDGTAPWLRCRITGRLQRTPAGVTAADVDAVLERFDPATGEAVWTAELEDASGLYVDEQPLVRLGEATFALALDGGETFTLDVATGRRVDVDPGTRGWCYSDNQFRQAEGPQPNRIGPDFTTPCDLTGRPHDTPVEPDESVGIQVDRIFIWMDAEGLHGARLRA